MFTVNTAAAWLAISSVYILSAMFLHFRYRDVLPRTVPAVFLSVGLAIFIGVNRSRELTTDTELLVSELAIFLLLSIGWGFTMALVYSYINLQESLDAATTTSTQRGDR